MTATGEVVNSVAEPQTAKTPSLLTRAGALFTPNASLPARILYGITIAEIILFVVGWMLGPGIFPTPLEVVQQYPSLMEDGLVGNLISSVLLSVEAIMLSTLISLTLSYLSVVPVVRPIVDAISKLRFLSLVGLGVFFHAFVGGGHAMKLAMLTFGMSVFFVSSMATIVQQVPTSMLDYVRTLKATKFQVMWEAQVLGTAGYAFDILADTAAMSWLMLTAVEGIVRTEGGIGVMLLSENKHYNIAGIIAVQLLFLGAGILQDFVIRNAKRILAYPFTLTYAKE